MRWLKRLWRRMWTRSFADEPFFGAWGEEECEFSEGSSVTIWDSREHPWSLTGWSR